MATRREMDTDGRSQVSSFYGRPSSNMDSLPRQPRQHAQDPASPNTPGTGNRRDSTSSFFRPDEYGATQGLDYDSTNRRGGGYDRTSYYGIDGPKGDLGTRGKDEETGQEWDVYADFNNAGPRYAAPFVPDDGYRAIRDPTASEGTAANQVELVTVPALGAEWKASELRDMTKSGRAEARAEERRRKWREFNRDQRGLCGQQWATRRTLVVGIFFMVVVIGVLLAIFIPRVPGFGFLGEAPLSAAADGGNPQFLRSPANFSFDALIDLQVNTNSQVVLPLHFNNIHATVYDVTTSRLVATGDLGDYSVPAKSYAEIKVPVTFSYQAANSSDPTWLNFYNACKNKSQVTGGQRPGLQLRLVLELSIAGLINKPTAGTQINDANCPIELPSNAG
ncbi:hypothetical protein BDV93DRAFT_468734 [Ceratobasidium sp. AG-I]|nr:hypothetical protein BDV93DRAFT_468734 [Ceratobasidium sp. AG-I]